MIDSIRNYLIEIGKTPLLTHEEEVVLAQKVQAALSFKSILEEEMREPTSSEVALLKRGEIAKKKMIQANLRMVVSIAKKYVKHGAELMDLIQEGSIGLSRAVDKFDPTKGYRFSTYSYWWIRQAMTRSLTSKSRVIQLPQNVVSDIRKIKREANVFKLKKDRFPHLPELAALVGMNPKKVVSLLTMSRPTVSLDVSRGDDASMTLMNAIGTCEISVDDSLDQVDQLLKELPQKEEWVIRAHYGLLSTDDGFQEPMTLDAIAARIGLSRERIRQIQTKGIRSIRSKLRRSPELVGALSTKH